MTMGCRSAVNNELVMCGYECADGRPCTIGGVENYNNGIIDLCSNNGWKVQ